MFIRCIEFYNPVNGCYIILQVQGCCLHAMSHRTPHVCTSLSQNRNTSRDNPLVRKFQTKCGTLFGWSPFDFPAWWMVSQSAVQHIQAWMVRPTHDIIVRCWTLNCPPATFLKRGSSGKCYRTNYRNLMLPNSKIMASGITETEYVDKHWKVISAFCDKSFAAEKVSSLATNFCCASQRRKSAYWHRM